MQKLSAQQWSRYWQKGTTTTFIGRFKNNYDGEIENYWQQIFTEIKPNSEIVDLATGNGALAILAGKCAQNLGYKFSISAIDYALIDPTGNAHKNIDQAILENITFIENTPIEASHLNTNKFDCGISQFGFEYASPKSAVKELNRILKPQATVALMMHKTGSVLHQQALDGRKQAAICQTSGLHTQLTALLKLTDKLKLQKKQTTQSAAAELKRNEINEITGQLHRDIENHKEPTQLEFYLQNSMLVFSPRYSGLDLKGKLTMLASIEEETFAYDQRMMDLVTAARTNDDIQQLESLFSGFGFNIQQSKTFIFEGHEFCHSLILKR